MAYEVVVVGLGYVGLPVCLLAAKNGAASCGVDVNVDLISSLNAGFSPTAEPEVQALLHQLTADSRISFSTEVPVADYYVIAVPTPTDAAHFADLTAVTSAVGAVAAVMSQGACVIIESTCPPGTTTGVVRTELERSGLRAGIDFSLAYSPERILPGNTIAELVGNDRTVGGLTPACSTAAAEFYRRVVSGTIHETDALTAELSKLAENTFRDVNIALANELAAICEEIGASGREVIRMANFHPRVNILQPGPGVGGHCIAVDPWFLVEAAPQQSTLIATARKVNDGVPARLARQLVGRLGNGRHKFAILGLAYKPNVGDIRESPSIELAKLLMQFGHDVVCFDSLISTPVPELTICGSFEEALHGADMAILATDHDDLAAVLPETYAAQMVLPRVLDTRGRYSAEKFAAAGVALWEVGKSWP